MILTSTLTTLLTPCTIALNAVLGNLSLEQLEIVPTHRCGHTLDWLIMNRTTDVLDLTTADMLLSDPFVISFDLLLRKPGRATKKVTSSNIRSVDMYAFRTDLRSQTVKQAKVEWRIAEQKWRQSGLTVHREIYAKQRNLVSNLISKAKTDYICEKIIDCDSSRELFRLSNQMIGTFKGTVLPSNIPKSLLLISFVNFLLVRLSRLEAALTLTAHSPVTLLSSLGLPLQNLTL